MAFAAETICVQGSNERKDPFGAISMPIYQNAAYAHPGLGKSTGYDYSRCSNHRICCLNIHCRKLYIRLNPMLIQITCSINI